MLREGFGNFIEKVKSWLGIKAKKIVEEKSEDLFQILNTPNQNTEQKYPYIAHDNSPQTKDIQQAVESVTATSQEENMTEPKKTDTSQKAEPEPIAA